MEMRVAIVSALGLGDGLLSMVLLHNLKQHGYQVTLFSDYLTQLQEWFPDCVIKNYPVEIKNQQTAAEIIQKIFQPFDLIISTDGAPLMPFQNALTDKYRVFYEQDFDKNKTIAANFLAILQNFFHIKNLTLTNGLVIPPSLQLRKHKQRIIIHPTSSCSTKNWLPHKFLQLAQRLQKQSFQPVFIVSPTERKEWSWIESCGFSLPNFANLDQLARFIAESGYMIGNDSGIGHLASNLGVPTLSLFARSSRASLWRPSWSHGEVITAAFQLPGARLRTRYWKKFLTVRRVFAAFNKLHKNHSKEN